MINIFKNGSGDYMAKYIINLSGNICELLIILCLLKDNYKPRVKKQLFIPLCVIFTAFQFLNTNLFLSKSSLIVLGSLIFTFIILLLYNLEWKNRIAYTFFLFITMGLSEIIIGMILTYLLGVDLSFTQNNYMVFAVATVTSKFLAYLLILFAKKVINNKSPKRHRTYRLLPLPIASILVMILFLRCCYQIEDKTFMIITLVSSIILAFANVTIFYIIDKLNELINAKEKLLFAEKHINNQVLHYQQLNKHQNELKLFRHDIKNQYLSLIALVKDCQFDKALKIMEANVNWLEEMNSNIINSGNPVVDAILQSKLHLAKEKNITLKISTKLAEEIAIDELELGIVLGNALDNAIEAVEKNIKSDNKYISMTLMSTNYRISISVSNPVEEDINTENLTTSKADKEKHGYGIKSIRAIAQKYDGIVLFTCEDKIFTVNINVRNYHT